jgi:putative nucleotidyltransferase with HDIG domain
LGILVADDDISICNLVCTKLRVAGFVCQSCVRGDVAIELLKQQPFDAVISDLKMPGATGFELLEATRRLLPHAAFLMATGVDDLSVGIAAMQKGATDYLVKPFRMDAVIASLNRALDTKRVEAELENYRKHLEEMVYQRTKQLTAAMQRIESIYDETLEALAAALDLRDNETWGHSRRVTFYSLTLAAALKLPSDLVKQIEWGAYLHDIGKIGIPDSILLKPGDLTAEETAIMQTHARIGYELMSRVAFLATAAEIVLAHQEHFDGTGYPQGLAGEDIPIGARIFAVADTLDAIMSDRPYRQRQPYAVARSEITSEAGKQFDPTVVAAFLDLPEGTWERIRIESALTRPDLRYTVKKIYALGGELQKVRASIPEMTHRGDKEDSSAAQADQGCRS